MTQPQSAAKARILVVEDDPAITFGLSTNLSFEGYTVDVTDSRAGAIARAGAATPDLIVLDLMLPDGSGFQVMDDLRKKGYAGRILVLSARLEETDKVTALRIPGRKSTDLVVVCMRTHMKIFTFPKFSAASQSFRHTIGRP